MLIIRSQLGPPFSHAIGFTYTTTMLHRKLRDSLRWTITREAWVIYIYFCFVSELIISWTNKAISLFFKSTMIYLFVPQLHLSDPVRWSFLFSSRHFFLCWRKAFFRWTNVLLPWFPRSVVFAPSVLQSCYCGATASYWRYLSQIGGLKNPLVI